MWALMSHTPDALLEHAVERLYTMETARVEEENAAAVDLDLSAAFAPLPKSTKYLPYRIGVGESGSGSASASASAAGNILNNTLVMSWNLLRSAGAGFWLRDQGLLKKTAETLAKAQFALKRSPDDAALLYLALGKQSVLHGLYRSTQQAKQAEFLSRDFTVEKHRHAACKNAFVLLGKHRRELAAAFFILGKKRQVHVDSHRFICLVLTFLMHPPSRRTLHYTTPAQQHVLRALGTCYCTVFKEDSFRFTVRG